MENKKRPVLRLGILEEIREELMRAVDRCKEPIDSRRFAIHLVRSQVADDSVTKLGGAADAFRGE